MASNVLPFFWDLASSSKSTRLNASADLVSSLQSFQSTFTASQPNGLDSDDEAEEDSEDDEESGEEVDGSDDEDENGESDAEAKLLDKRLGKQNAEDVVYSVKRLVRGLASSRESSRLGFAVALTEVGLPDSPDLSLVLTQ
jgi:DNA polymerase phi